MGTFGPMVLSDLWPKGPQKTFGPKVASDLWPNGPQRPLAQWSSATFGPMVLSDLWAKGPWRLLAQWAHWGPLVVMPLQKYLRVVRARFGPNVFGRRSAKICSTRLRLGEVRVKCIRATVRSNVFGRCSVRTWPIQTCSGDLPVKCVQPRCLQAMFGPIMPDHDRAEHARSWFGPEGAPASTAKGTGIRTRRPRLQWSLVCSPLD